MAEFDSLSSPIDASDPLGELLWSNDAFIETAHELYFTQNGMTYSRRAGADPHTRYPGLPICLFEDFGKKAGSMISIPMRKNLTRTPRTTTYGAYTYSYTSMLGVEEGQVYYDLDLRIALLKHAVGRNAPDFYDHNTSLDLSSDAEDLLKRWLVENSEEAMLDAMYEKYPYFAQQHLSVSAVAHPRIVYAGGVDDQDSLTAAAVLNGQEAMRMRSYARNRKLNPIQAAGRKDLYVVLADTFVCADLQSSQLFRDLKDAMPSGPDNPIVSGSIGVFKGLAFHEYERMRVMTSGAQYANVGRALLLGADALCVGYGSRPRLAQRKEDAYGDRWGLAIRQVWGASRADFADDANTTVTQQSSAEWRVWRTAETFAA